MLSWTQAQQLVQWKTNNTDAGALTIFKRLMNLNHRNIMNSFDFYFLQKSVSIFTVANQQFYDLPNDFRKVRTGATTTLGTVNFPMVEVPDKQSWERLNQIQYKSNFAKYWWIENGQFGVHPISSTTGNKLNIPYKVKVKDLTIDDYTTGTIVTLPMTFTLTASLSIGDLSATLSGAWSLPTGTYSFMTSANQEVVATFTNGSTAVIWLVPLTVAGSTTITTKIIAGSGCTWTANMVGRRINFDEASGGDGYWYDIASFVDSTHLILSKYYQGTAITAGSATYTIGQTFLFPDGYDELPALFAAYQWSITKLPEKKDIFKEEYVTLYTQFLTDYGSKSNNPAITEMDNYEMVNPNLTVLG